jgi:CRP-like cAMP-binding protein
VFQAVLQSARHVVFEKGQVLLVNEARAESFFVIKEGAVDSDMQVMTVGPGATVGLKSLLTQAPVRELAVRHVRDGVIARERVQCFEWSAAVLAMLIAKYPSLEKAMWKSVGQQIAQEVSSRHF